MNKARLEAISDGVIAIIITIMVLEMKVFLLIWVAFLIYVIVAGFWVIPDRRHENQIVEKGVEVNK